MMRTGRGLVVLAAILVAGCAGQEAKKVQLAGKVTFKGQPVPAGYIAFTPDFNQGNAGKDVRVVQIKDGVYDSSTEQDPGIYAGPTIIRIAGFDCKPLPQYPQGKQIFNSHDLRETLEGGTKDFDVPASAAQKTSASPRWPTTDVRLPSYSTPRTNRTVVKNQGSVAAASGAQGRVCRADWQSALQTPPVPPAATGP
jgi:hypothetical protein